MDACDLNAMEPHYTQAADLIASADALVIAAGAGMGVDSGLPDFRGRDGFWQAYPALAKAKLDFTEVASPRTFVRDPALAWGFYGHRLGLYRRTLPHAGFDTLREWGQRMPLGCWVFTSNVDGQFQKAGFSEQHIHECHGSIHYLQCLADCGSGTWSAADFTPEVDDARCRLVNAPPRCPRCGGLARPNILMFGDGGWVDLRTQAQRRREARWFESLANSRAKLVVVELGAGTAIPSVRHFSHQLCRDHGARLIRINPREPQVPRSMDVGLALGSRVALRAIDAALDEARGD